VGRTILQNFYLSTNLFNEKVLEMSFGIENQIIF